MKERETKRERDREREIERQRETETERETERERQRERDRERKSHKQGNRSTYKMTNMAVVGRSMYNSIHVFVASGLLWCCDKHKIIL